MYRNSRGHGLSSAVLFSTSVFLPLFYSLVAADPVSADWYTQFATQGMNGEVRALVTYDDHLIAGGAFTMAGTTPANRIARWNGSSWEALGTGLNGAVEALAVYGGKLYAGGAFTQAGGGAALRIACWDGATWSPVGAGANGQVLALAVFSNQLYAGGVFTMAGGDDAFHIARWNGASWSTVGTGMNQTVASLASDATRLVAGGDFTTASGGGANRVAVWNGSSWSALGSGIPASVLAVCIWDGKIVAGGTFTEVGGTIVGHIARWSGSAWQGIGGGFTSWVTDLAIYNGDLVATGTFDDIGHIARSSGGGWSSFFPGGLDAEGLALHADGPWLYVGGAFGTAGGETSEDIAAWSDIPVAVEPGSPGAAIALAPPSPNPSRGLVHFSYELPAGGEASLRVYDAAGRLVVTLAEGEHTAGPHVALWDGRSDGMPARAGVYFAHLVSRGEGRTVRVVRLMP